MKISYNPETNLELTASEVSSRFPDDIIFDLSSSNIWAKGKLFSN
jgi:hypothetical protein